MSRLLTSMTVFTLALASIGAVPLAPAFGQTYDGNGYGGRQIIMDDPAPAQMNAMPSYRYDPALDPKNLPVPPQTLPQAKDLGTQAGLDLALQISGYQYAEPSLGVTLTGPKLGLNATLTDKFYTDWFVSADVRGAFGFSDYKGSGTQNGDFEDLWDIRGLIGRDFIGHTFSLSPYLGVGFRDFNSDDRGTSSTGAQGYRRENQLLYVPIGIEPKFAVTDDARIATNLEYDFVAEGWQTSTLSDANVGFPNITNRQKSGYGLRGTIMWENNRWAAGPFVDYWRIQQSDTTCATGSAYGLCGYEPSNHTIEGGVQFRYHFF